MKDRLIKKFEDEIHALNLELKLELPREIKRARELGDLRENAEYHAAKERQRLVESRISMLQTRVAEIALNLDLMLDGNGPERIDTLLHEMLQRIGVKVNVVKEGHLKDMGAFYREPTEEEKQKEQALLDNPCDRPLETCIQFGMAAQYYLENGLGRKISPDELMAILQAGEEKALVLSPTNAKEIINICMCCGCCCGILRTLKAIERSQVVLLLIDAVEGLTAQDAHIAGLILEKRRGVVLLINKWDLVEKDDHTLETYRARLQAELPFLDFAPLLFISALTGQRTGQILPLALQVQEESVRRVPTSQLNRVLQEAADQHPPPSRAGRPLKLYFAAQTRTAPPTFEFQVNDPTLVHFSYARFLENALRRRFGFLGVPIQLRFVGRGKNDAS